MSSPLIIPNTPSKRKRTPTDRYGYKSTNRPEFFDFDHSFVVRRIRPVINDTGYSWKQFEIKKSKSGLFDRGVFARNYLRPGLVIPILGHIIKKKSKNVVAVWKYGSETAIPDEGSEFPKLPALSPCCLGPLEGKMVGKNIKKCMMVFPI